MEVPILFMTDACLEKMKRSGYRMDVIIKASGYPAQIKTVSRWATSYVEPNDDRYRRYGL